MRNSVSSSVTASISPGECVNVDATILDKSSQGDALRIAKVLSPPRIARFALDGRYIALAPACGFFLDRFLFTLSVGSLTFRRVVDE